MIGYAGLRTAKAARGAYAKLLAAGLTSLILCQALLNVYTVLGLAPLTGVPLPFISSGSTSLIVLLCAMGLLLNVAGGGSTHLRAVRGAARGGRAMSAPRIVIAAGGTAGHVVPAIAVADALRAEGAEVSFVGGAAGRGRAGAGRRLPARPDPGRGHLAHQPAEGAARAVGKAARRAAHARARSCAARGADAVLGGGGYVAGPVGPRGGAAARPARARPRPTRTWG